MVKKIGSFAVVCPDWRQDGFMTREAAEDWIKMIEELGRCQQEHRIEIVSNV